MYDDIDAMVEGGEAHIPCGELQVASSSLASGTTPGEAATAAALYTRMPSQRMDAQNPANTTPLAADAAICGKHCLAGCQAHHTNAGLSDNHYHQPTYASFDRNVHHIFIYNYKKKKTNWKTEPIQLRYTTAEALQSQFFSRLFRCQALRKQAASLVSDAIQANATFFFFCC